jgi:hypothetical protein
VIIDVCECLHIPALCRLACCLIGELARAPDIAKGPEDQCQVDHCGGDLVLAKSEGEIAVSLAVEYIQRLFDVGAGCGVIPEIKVRQARYAVSHAGFWRVRTARSFMQKGRCRFSHFQRFRTVEAADPLAVTGGEAVSGVTEAGGECLRLGKGRTRFLSAMTARMDQSVCIRRLQLQPALARCGGVLHVVSLGKCGEQRLRFLDLGKFQRGRKALERGR